MFKYTFPQQPSLRIISCRTLTVRITIILRSINCNKLMLKHKFMANQLSNMKYVCKMRGL